MTTGYLPAGKKINVLVVDDSLEFRRMLRDIFSRSAQLHIIAEAENGVQALDLALRLRPDVIIMDMEMPQLDGLSTLHQLMAFAPIPTIMISSLSREGSNRSFDAIKGGAVDFIYKGSFPRGKIDAFEHTIIHRIVCAAKVVVSPDAPFFSAPTDIPPTPQAPSDIIFCEECGARNIFEAEQKRLVAELRCCQCNDLLEENLIKKHRRINRMTVLGAGHGGYSSLISVISHLPEDLHGTILAVIYEKSSHIDTFSQYLNEIGRINVLRMVDGLTVEGGNCYVASAYENFYLRPYSAQYTIRKTKDIEGYGAIDILMNSVAAVFNTRAAGIILSGEETDGDRGLKALKKNGGVAAILHPSRCLFSQMGLNAHNTCQAESIADVKGINRLITSQHQTEQG